MFDASVFEDLPVFVRTGPELLEPFVNFCIDNGFSWIAETTPKENNFSIFAHEYGNEAGVSLCRYKDKKVFLFDSLEVHEAGFCADTIIFKKVDVHDLFAIRDEEFDDVDEVLF